MLGWYAATFGAARPAELRVRAQVGATQALADAGFPWARLKISDSVGVLHGDAPDEPARAALERRARELLAPYMGLPGVFLGLDNRVRVRTRQAHAETYADLPPTGAGLAASVASADPVTGRGLGAACSAAFEAALGGEAIHFRAASSQLEAPARPLLKRLGSVAVRCPAWRVIVEGHADGRGDTAVNERLARRRAASVAAELLLQGVPIGQLETVGLVTPAASTPGGAAADALAAAAGRRVAFRFVQAEAD
jgi:outer membrane protein OmpA-like peptidoglycan-associated protein